MTGVQARPRAAGAQIDRMHVRWPDFEFGQRQGLLTWRGPLQPIQRIYLTSVTWPTNGIRCPYVTLIDPPLRPRPGGSYEQIPHLIFDTASPAMSALCLFDPAGNEWNSSMLIADTTIVWASRWLYFYELWHFDGVWRGGGVGEAASTEARA